MKRRTNLFYNGTTDSNKFMTFSNYTESLTSSFLSLETSVFPTTFLCLYMPGLTTEAGRQDFIKNHLAAHYENKESFLRDWCINNDKLCQSYLQPLNYLLETMMKYTGGVTVSVVENITEQDYNGIYSDTICVVNTDKYYTGEIVTKESETWSPEKVFVDYPDTSYLYGWYGYTETSYEYNIPKEYSSVKPSFDNGLYDKSDRYYNYDSICSYIEFSENKEYTKEVKFNVVVPLYTVVNKNAVDADNSLNVGNGTVLKSDYYTNVPLGIWFSGNEAVVLKRNDHYKPSWSLVIGSQFKPYPSSADMPTEITKKTTADAYNTFAMVLTRQNEIIDKYLKMQETISNINDRLTLVESKLKDIGTTKNIDNLVKEIENIKKSL